jgi:hypothetical protein
MVETLTHVRTRRIMAVALFLLTLLCAVSHAVEDSALDLKKHAAEHWCWQPPDDHRSVANVSDVEQSVRS